jgi:Family of unknown function (DUF5994)
MARDSRARSLLGRVANKVRPGDPEPQGQDESPDRPSPEASPEQASPEQASSEQASSEQASSEQPASDAPAPDDQATSGFQVQTDRLTVDERFGTGALDGAWWPTSSTAADAVPELVGELADAVGRVTRIALSMPDWTDEKPKTVHVRDHVVHLAWFAGMPRHTARVTFEEGEVITLLLVPPETEQDTASAVLATAAEDRSLSLLAEKDGEG